MAYCMKKISANTFLKMPSVTFTFEPITMKMSSASHTPGNEYDNYDKFH